MVPVSWETKKESPNIEPVNFILDDEVEDGTDDTLTYISYKGAINRIQHFNDIIDHNIPDIRSTKSLNSIIFELLITFPKLSLFRCLNFILTYINGLKNTEMENGVIILFLHRVMTC